MTTNFPTLFKKSETGAIVTWEIRVEPVNPCDGPVPPDLYANIITCWGQEGSAGQKTIETIREGKNAGKKNATTPYQQAVKDAKSKWEKQQKAKKYVQSREDALSGKRDEEFVEGGIDPMLAHPREKKPKALLLPCDDQPKLDGFRCIAHIEPVEGSNVPEVSLWSRTRKRLNEDGALNHIVAALAQQFIGIRKAFFLDGELYNHEMRLELGDDFFQYLSSLIKRNQPDSARIEYHVYDLADASLTWEERKDFIAADIGPAPRPLILVETREARSEEELAKHEEEYVGLGYEGLMARNKGARYQPGKRSADLLKVKRFIDKEFLCINVEVEMRVVSDSQGTREVPYPKFIVLTENGTQVPCPMMGKLSYVARFTSQPELVLGKKLTVKFQGYTADGSLRFPKARMYTTL